jgi:hypothetical protein
MIERNGMKIRLIIKSLVVVLVSACASGADFPVRAAVGYNITSVSVDTSQLDPNELIGLPSVQQINADFVRALERELAAGSSQSGRPASFNFQISLFQLRENGANGLNPNSFSRLLGEGEIRDAATGEVLVQPGLIFSVTPRSMADSTEMLKGMLTGNQNLVKSKEQDYQDTINHFAASLRDRAF